MFFRRIAIIGSFALTTPTSGVVAADGGALEGRRSVVDRDAQIDARRAGPHGAADCDAGVDVNIADSNDNAPLQHARRRGRFQRGQDFAAVKPIPPDRDEAPSTTRQGFSR